MGVRDELVMRIEKTVFIKVKSVIIILSESTLWEMVQNDIFGLWELAPRGLACCMSSHI